MVPSNEIHAGTRLDRAAFPLGLLPCRHPLGTVWSLDGPSLEPCRSTGRRHGRHDCVNAPIPSADGPANPAPFPPYLLGTGSGLSRGPPRHNPGPRRARRTRARGRGADGTGRAPVRPPRKDPAQSALATDGRTHSPPHARLGHAHSPRHAMPTHVHHGPRAQPRALGPRPCGPDALAGHAGPPDGHGAAGPRAAMIRPGRTGPSSVSIDVRVSRRSRSRGRSPHARGKARTGHPAQQSKLLRPMAANTDMPKRTGDGPRPRGMEH